MSFTDPATPNANGYADRRSVAIDLNAALDILAQRSSSHLGPDHRGHVSHDDAGQLPNTALSSSEASRSCGCCFPGTVDGPNSSSSWNARMKFQGQCIEVGSSAVCEDPLAPFLNDAKSGSGTNAIENEFNASLWRNQKEQIDAQQRAVVRQEELASKLQSMSIEEVIATVFQVQEGRVETYRFYDEALEHILATGNVQYYPPVCANVTATFSVLSSTINAIRSNLEQLESEPNIREIQDLLTRLQRSEQSKLQLTAALHLERMRSVAEVQKQQAKVNQTVDRAFDIVVDNRETVAELLNESILLLRKKITLVIGEINDVLEDLRYSIPENDKD